MPIERYFLGWDAPVVAKVREFLLPQELSGPVDLGKDLIVVPTLQAGRRLRDMLALWSPVLTKIDLAEYKGLFPARVAGQDFGWAVATAERIEQLRDELADGGWTLESVFAQMGSILEEPDRWRDLAKLESAYLEQLSKANLQDPSSAMIRRAGSPELPGRVERIVVAAVADPTPLMIKALDTLKRRVSIVVLVHAPESMADDFDEGGERKSV